MRSKLQSLLLVTSLICLFITGPVNASGKVNATNQSTNRNTTNSNACPDKAKSTKANSGNSRAQSCTPTPPSQPYFETASAGQLAYGANAWGQTFTIPVGYSGTINSISNIKLVCYADSPTAQVSASVDIYNSFASAQNGDLPLRTANSLLNLTSCATDPSGFAAATFNFTAEFSPLNVTAGQQLYFELTRVSSAGAVYQLYFTESLSNPYADGFAYRSDMAASGRNNLSSYLGEDLEFRVNMTLVP